MRVEIRFVTGGTPLVYERITHLIPQGMLKDAHEDGTQAKRRVVIYNDDLAAAVLCTDDEAVPA